MKTFERIKKQEILQLFLILADIKNILDLKSYYAFETVISLTADYLDKFMRRANHPIFTVFYASLENSDCFNFSSLLNLNHNKLHHFRYKKVGFIDRREKTCKNLPFSIMY